jgi:hypothetical protein
MAELKLVTRCAALVLAATAAAQTDANSLRYFGGASSGDVDRVKIKLDNPETPIDVGDTDFTVEFFMRTASGNNASVGCDQNGWTQGNIIIDRDRFGNSRDFGVSIGDGRVAFGVTGPNVNNQETVCGTLPVADGNWHHVAVQRRVSDGRLFIYVDGQLDEQEAGPSGDISYPDGATPVSGCGSNQSQACTNDPYFVIAAEKHDLALGFSGWVDELRVSTVLRYSGNFTPPTQPFDPTTAATAALYHFDEGSGSSIADARAGNLSPGVVRFNGQLTRPQWSTETPFTAGPGTVQFALASDAIDESGGTRAVQVTRSGGSSGAASVSYQITDISTTAGADYTAASTGTLTWTNNDAAAKSIGVTIVDDAQAEADETLELTLSSPSGASLGTRTTTTLAITDDDSAPPGTLQWSTSAITVNEAAGTVTLNVSRAGGSAGPASVQYQTANGSANAPGDYSAANGGLSWADGDGTPKPVTVSIANDTADEPNETFTIVLSSATGANLGGPATVTVTINDDDPPPSPGTLQFTSGQFTVSEGVASIPIAVSRSGGTAGAASVVIQVSGGTATQGTDYTIASGTLQWEAGVEGNETLIISINDDALVEGAETVDLRLVSFTGAAPGTRTTTRLTIADNDIAPAGSLQFTASAYSVNEFAGSATILVSRTGGTAGSVTVRYQTADGTAAAPIDYTATSGMLTWADGDTAAKSFTVPVVNDSVLDPAETISLALSNATGGAVIGAPLTATLTITDDEVARPGIVEWTASSYAADESAGTVTVTATRSGGSDGSISVTVSTRDDSANSGSDYTAVSRVLSWADGDSSARMIAIPLLDDAGVEITETFMVLLSAPTGGASVGAPSTTVTVRDDDTPPVQERDNGGGGRMELLTLLATGLALWLGMRRPPAIASPRSSGTQVRRRAP